MILTLLSMFGGGLMRLLPEVFAFLNKKSDYSHELAMMDKQLEFQRSKAADDRATIGLQGDIDQSLAMMSAYKSALDGQMQKTGLQWADALNFLVRPLTTYYFLLLYGSAKLAMFVIALQSGISGWDAILKVYDAEDRAILSSILAFWFVGRIFDKQK